MLKAGDTLTTTKPTLNAIEADGMQDYLAAILGENLGIRTQCPIPTTYEEDPPWPGGWEPVTDDGKITKRISSWLRKEYGVKLNNYDLATVGQYAANLVVPPGIKIEVTDKFDWDPGDYGDHGSCFFGGRRQTWSYLHHLGGRAAKFYLPDKKPGRCLVVDDDEQVPIAFNFYGLAFHEGGAILQSALEDVPIGTASPFLIGGSSHEIVYINHTLGHAVGRGGQDRASRWADTLMEDTHLRRYCEGCHRELEFSVPLHYQEDRDLFTGAGVEACVCQECYRLLSLSSRKKWMMAKLVAFPLKGEHPAPPKKKTKKKAAHPHWEITIGREFIIEQAQRDAIVRLRQQNEEWIHREMAAMRERLTPGDLYRWNPLTAEGDDQRALEAIRRFTTTPEGDDQ